MYNIFDILPNNFFNVFIGENKRIISDCLYLVYSSFKSDLSFTCSREQVLLIFQDYFENHVTDLQSDEQLDNSRDKALYILKRLRECGWVNEETGENYEIFITFEDYSIKVLENLFSLDMTNDNSEYSGLIYNIYMSFNSFDVNRGDLVFETAYENTKELATKLKNLNSNIKKYIQNLLNEGIKDDLEALLNSLLQDYQTKIVDRAYYNLTTYDNPSKYRQKIINKIEEIIEDEHYFDLIVRNIMERKDIGYKEAMQLLMMQKDYIVDSFEHIEDIMQEIDSKNNKFIESAINRITFLLNNQNDIEGRINNIIKSLIFNEEAMELGNIYLNSFISKDSLYVPRNFSKPLEINLISEAKIDKSLKNEKIESLISKQKYSHKFIEEKVLKLLKTNGPFFGSSLPINNNDDLATLILIFMYGYTYNTKYEIEPLNEEVNVNNYRFKDFKVKEKLNG
ncbi:hypothetical protein B5E92_06325 [Erysipelatoclostridium sp. An15]|uniref:Wadjet anti-phage system protein JetA family protein n=1 Tax=Erysipelatoclostridium sp. An15 TaxID=1965566 RepID=UPI000B3675FB|nr:Wadjet anti-phage system protein JetA family protein [Erysipelatoclostridium sp. An15]OUQ07826.1 hypothetical protein B5E92_06325 [Erysipelatoclostridium sp. An15]